MPFHVICLETQEPVNDMSGQPHVFATGHEAADMAERYTAALLQKYKPMRIKTDPGAWKKREADRFADGTYTTLPWHKEQWFAGSIGTTEHFAHVSKEKPGMIAFTENDDKGEADIRTRIKAGVYLERYFNNVLTAASIQSYARDFAGRYETNGLKFATTEDEIARVYIHGPRSCMSGPEKGLYQSPMHPARVYAAGDLAVAYLERGGSIIARSVVWPDKKLYYNVYGDNDRLRPLLNKDGYKNGRLTGAKLKRIEYKKGGTTFLVCPHIDGDGRVTVHDDHLTIGGPIPASSTSGAIHLPHGTQCTCCGTWGHDKAKMVHYPDVKDSLYCTSCQKGHTYVCKATGVRYGNASSIYLMGGGGYYWSREHFKKHGFVCDASGDYLPKEEAIKVGSETWGRRAFKEMGFHCSQCDRNFPVALHTRGKSICRYCNAKKAGS